MGIHIKSKTVFIITGLIFMPMVTMSLFTTPASAATEYFSTDTYATYDINYQIDFNSTDSSAVDIISWVSRWSNWTNVQESELMEIKLSSPVDTQSFDPEDIYNNSFDYFATELGAGGDSLRIEIKYRITLNARRWEVPENVTLGDYNQTSDLYLLYTSEQPGCEVNDVDIQSTANTLKGSETSVNAIARAIYIYIVSNMNYQIQNEALGANITLETLTGDCSEFSSLMVCLLRASGIPARKVLGLGLVEGSISEASPRFDTEEGDSWVYNSPSITGDDDLPGHAWLQYYVPTIGWVSADPTWGQGLYESGLSRNTAYAEELSLQYFNQIDHVHLITSVGDYYGDGIDPSLVYLGGETGLLEFPFHYSLLSWTKTIFNPELDLTTAMIVEFEVQDSNYIIPEGFNIDLIQWATYLGSGVLLLTIGLAFISVRKRKKEQRAQDTYHR